MKILILGGTQFVGKHITLAALRRNHQVTLFNRGQSSPDWMPPVERLIGDRDTGSLDALRGRQFDAVIDVNAYVPRVVHQVLDVLGDGVGRYVFISTVSVYADVSQPGVHEDSPLKTEIDDPTSEQVTGERYGPLKVLCERAAQERLGERALIVRPGLVVGPDDHTDRFTYWPHKAARRAPFLAPEGPHTRLQFIDTRDLADFTVRLTEAGQSGVFNATGQPQTLGDIFAAANPDAQPVYAAADWLLAHDVQPFEDLPLWLPSTDTEWAGFHAVNIDRGVAAGLTFRPLATTVQDTLEWDRVRPPTYTLKAGMSAEREAALLAELGG